MKYVFFGSGPVAVESFKTLRNKFTFNYVVTKTTTSHFFSELITKETLITISNKKEVDDFATTIIDDQYIGILIDFGVIISEETISSFSHGIINSHFSLLPELRGADPITHAILDGLDTTGVSLMIVDQGMDTGNIIAQSRYNLPKNVYADQLTEDLITISNSMLEEFVPEYINGNIAAIPQDSLSDKVTYAGKISKSDGVITPEDTAISVDKKVRAFYGWPGVRTTLGDISVTITKGQIHDSSASFASGSLTKDKTSSGEMCLVLHTNEGAYAITEMKPDGKKSMSAQAFLAGYANKLPLAN